MRIAEAQLGPEHPQTATSLNNLAVLYQSQGRFADALPLYERSLMIREAQLGPEHPSTAGSLNNLAVLYANMGEWDEALPLMERAVRIRLAALGGASRYAEFGAKPANYSGESGGVMDGQVKNRPAVVLRVLPPFGDLPLCGISINPGQRVPDFDGWSLVPTGLCHKWITKCLLAP